MRDWRGCWCNRHDSPDNEESKHPAPTADGVRNPAMLRTTALVVRAHAEECRQLAARAGVKARDQLLKMAETWDSLADDREKQLARMEHIKQLDGNAGSEDQT